MDYQLNLGSVVVSTQGRDAGRVYMISAIVDKDYVLVVDGDIRKFTNPKKKRIKHLKPTGAICENIATKLASDKKVFDAEVYSALKNNNK